MVFLATGNNNYHVATTQTEHAYCAKGVAIRPALKPSKSHGVGGIRLKEIINTNHVQLKPRISRQWFNQNVF